MLKLIKLSVSFVSMFNETFTKAILQNFAIKSYQFDNKNISMQNYFSTAELKFSAFNHPIIIYPLLQISMLYYI